MADGETGAEVYSAAADRDQAGLVFGVAAQMVRNDPALAEACYIVESHKRIVHKSSGSFYRAISAEAYSKHGFNPSWVIYDELHAAPDRRLFDVLSTSMGARKQPGMLVISTAGYDRHSILYELYQHGKKVLEHPDLDPSFLPILYEAPPTPTGRTSASGSRRIRRSAISARSRRCGRCARGRRRSRRRRTTSAGCISISGRSRRRGGSR